MMDDNRAIIEALTNTIPNSTEIRAANILRSIFQADYIISQSKLSSIKKDLKKIKLFQEKIEGLNMKIKTARDEMVNPVVSSSLDVLSLDLDKANKGVRDALAKFEISQKRLEDYSKTIKEDVKKRHSNFEGVLKKRNRGEVLNAVLYNLLLELKSFAAIVKFFKKFPELTPQELGKTFNEELIRKRVERYKAKNNIN